MKSVVTIMTWSFIYFGGGEGKRDLLQVDKIISRLPTFLLKGI